MLRRPTSKPTHNVVVKIDGIWREIGAAWWQPDAQSMNVSLHPLVDLSRLATLAPGEKIRIFPRTRRPARSVISSEPALPDDDFDPDTYTPPPDALDEDDVED